MVTKPSVAEAYTHGASGMAQLRARDTPCAAGPVGPASGGGAGRATCAPGVAATATASDASTTIAAATANDTWMPDCPAHANPPPANGPMAKPAVSTAPAVPAPAGPLRSDAHAVPELMARPTPTPTTRRPTSSAPVCWDSSIATVPATVAAAPASAIGRRPNASDARPPISNPGSSPSA